MKNYKGKSYICMRCKNREPSNSTEFYCEYWDKKCSTLEKRDGCAGFVHMNTTFEMFDLDKAVKEYNEEVMEDLNVQD